MKDDLLVEREVPPVVYEPKETPKEKARWRIRAKRAKIATFVGSVITSAMAAGSYCDFLGGGRGLYSRIFGNLDSPAVAYIFGAATLALGVTHFVLYVRTYRMEIQAANGQAK
jgi:hypothetical protein